MTVGLAGVAGADAVPGCPVLVTAVEGMTGLRAPPGGVEDGWCVLDGARSSGEGLRITVERLRVRGRVVHDRLTSLTISARGLRASPALDDRSMPDWLRDLMRLQTAEVRLTLRREDDAERMLVAFGQLKLSGGDEAQLFAEIAGAELSKASLPTGRAMMAHLGWTYSGRTLRPAMEAIGAKLEPGATGTKAVLATRRSALGLVAAVPERSFPGDSMAELQDFIPAMPQHRGKFSLKVRSDHGIGAAQLALLALAKDPSGPEALARFFAGTEVSVSWKPRFQR